MFENGRRSAISTSELGLYSDRNDRYHKNGYALAVRKYVIGVMVVLAIVLAAILLYDFTSVASAAGKGSTETKHIYILQNAIKRSSNVSKRITVSTAPPEIGVNRTEIILMQDRSDDDGQELPQPDSVVEDQVAAESRSGRMKKSEPEFRAQNLNNFKLRKRILDSEENDSQEKPEAKEFYDNHAVVYRMRHRYKPPVSEEESNYEESRPVPFHFEYKTPHPASFKRPKYPQLSQYRYPQTSNNIQDILKYLAHDPENTSNRGIKFSGIYVNPKKYDLYPEVGEMMSNSDRSEEEEDVPYSYAFGSDPFYQYKPKHPSDVNLLAASNVRFSSSGPHRYVPPYDPYFPRPSVNFNRQPSSFPEVQYETPSTHATGTYGRKRKPKPFSVMLDIYPMSEVADPNKKSSRPRPPLSDEYDPRRPILYDRGPKFYAPPPQPIPVVPVPNHQGLTDDEERQQMIFHLNLYPKKKNKLNRNDIVERSQYVSPADREHFMDTIMSPIHSIAKHLTDHSTIQESRFEETDISETSTSPLTLDGDNDNRYEETDLNTRDEETTSFHNGTHTTNRETNFHEPDHIVDAPSNHRLNGDGDYSSTGKYDDEQEKVVETVTGGRCEDCSDPKFKGDDSMFEKNVKAVKTRDIDTVEGFQEFADGLMATD